MKYYGKGQVWLKVRVHGALVCLERPRGSDVQRLLTECPQMARALDQVSAAQRRAKTSGVEQEVSAAVDPREVREVCSFLAHITLSVEGMDWPEIPRDERACVWDEQGTGPVMQVFGMVVSAHAVPKIVDKLNLIADPPPAPVDPDAPAVADDPSRDHDPSIPPVDDLGEKNDPATDHDPHPGSSPSPDQGV